MTAFLLAALLAGSVSPIAARRGPIESREEWLLVQPHLNLPAVSPDPLPPGRTEVRLDFDWGSDFGWKAGPGGRASDLRYLVDGEHRTAAATVRRGLGKGWTVGARLPVRWRGGGLLDDVIDPFHRIFGFPDNGRPLFPSNRLRVEGRSPFVWRGRTGAGLGNVEVEAHRALGSGGGWAAAIVGRVSVPTGTGAFAEAGGGVGGQLLAARSLGSAFDAYLGLGGVLVSRGELEGITYRRRRVHGFMALEARPFRWCSLVLQGDAASRAVSNLESFPGLHGYLKAGFKIGVTPRWILEGGFTEGIVDLDSTTDFGIFVGVSRRF